MAVQQDSQNNVRTPTLEKVRSPTLEKVRSHILEKVRSHTLEWGMTIAKYLSNIHNRTDFLDYQPPSMFDTDNSHADQLSLAAQFEMAKKFDQTIQKKIIQNTITETIDCVEKIKVIANNYNKTRDTIDSLNKDNPLTSIINTLETTIKAQSDTNEINLFSLKHILFEAKTDVLKCLSKQYMSDKTGKTDPKELETLEKNDKNARQALEETMNAEIKKQMNAAQVQTSRRAFVQLLKDIGDANMLALLQKNQSAPLPDAAATGELPSRKQIETDIKQFQTVSGKTISQPREGMFQMKIPTRNNIFYHNGRQDYLLADLQMLALAVRASGYSKITMEFNGTNEKDIELIAQKAYDACIRTGFEGGKNGDISFKLNGVLTPLIDTVNQEGKVTKKGIFRHESDLDRYQSLEKQRDDVGKNANPTTPVTLSAPTENAATVSGGPKP